MRSALVLSTAIILFATGCNVQTGLAPTETHIIESSDRDFGFSGTWIPTPSIEVGADVADYQITIERDDTYTATVTNSSGKKEDELVVQFRTYEMSKDHPHAIVELELKTDGRVLYRRLAIAATKDDHLSLWMIDGRKIGEHLYNDGIAAVIEHFTFSTSVRCDSKKLLESITKHSAEIVGPAQVFKRKPEIGK